MTERFSLASVAALIGEPTRAAMLLALLDGRSLPAGELASIARLSAAATSLHLGKLIEGGLLAVRPEGRHRYYRLAGPEVAHALEALGLIATHRPPTRSLSVARSELRLARSCYDHFAGACAVAIADLLERENVLRVRDDRNYAITPHGARWLVDVMQIDVAMLPRTRMLARRCADWTERRPHIAGALGAAILQCLFTRRWVARTAESRALRITSRGSAGLAGIGLSADSLQARAVQAP